MRCLVVTLVSLLLVLVWSVRCSLNSFVEVGFLSDSTRVLGVSLYLVDFAWVLSTLLSLYPSVFFSSVSAKPLCLYVGVMRAPLYNHSLSSKNYIFPHHCMAQLTD